MYLFDGTQDREVGTVFFFVFFKITVTQGAPISLLLCIVNIYGFRNVVRTSQNAT